MFEAQVTWLSMEFIPFPRPSTLFPKTQLSMYTPPSSPVNITRSKVQQQARPLESLFFEHPGRLVSDQRPESAFYWTPCTSPSQLSVALGCPLQVRLPLMSDVCDSLSVNVASVLPEEAALQVI